MIVWGTQKESQEGGVNNNNNNNKGLYFYTLNAMIIQTIS